MKEFEIFFKASRKVSHSCSDYRRIDKRGANGKTDDMHASDDVIMLPMIEIVDGKAMRRVYANISIDCDKKTGEFRLFGFYSVK